VGLTVEKSQELVKKLAAGKAPLIELDLKVTKAKDLGALFPGEANRAISKTKVRFTMFGCTVESSEEPSMAPAYNHAAGTVTVPNLGDLDGGDEALRFYDDAHIVFDVIEDDV
jgi:hypothetical protein